MGTSDRVVARYLGLPLPSAHKKTAAFPPFPPKEETTSSRSIPRDHPFDKKALKPLSKALWASTVALGHALTAYRHLSRLKSTTVSPDGLLGGRGYVMKLGEMRQKLYEASEALSSISDTIYDEITAPHWKPKLAQLDENDREDVSRFVEEAQGVMENPEGEAEDKIEEIESENDGDEGEKQPGEEEDASSLPLADEAQSEPQPRSEMLKEAGNTLPRQVDLHSRLSTAVIKVPQSTRDVYLRLYGFAEPGGPRVDHRGPGQGEGPYGDYNNEDTPPGDSWSADGGGISRRDDTGEDYDYPSEWENEASSGTPTDVQTPTEAWDFGLGYGARGEGAGGYGNPSGEGRGDKGVYGPQSGLPGAPAQSSGDTTTLLIDDKLNHRQAEVTNTLYGVGELPQDVVGPPARSDYYPGPKDNLVSPMSSSDMPGPGNGAFLPDPGDPDLVDTLLTVENVDSPYIRYDYTTNTYREPGGDHPGQSHQEPWAPDGESTR